MKVHEVAFVPTSPSRGPRHETMSLLEATETLQDFADETGGEIEGPVVQAKKKLHMCPDRRIRHTIATRRERNPTARVDMTSPGERA